MSSQKKIALFGGTFDPVHNGHLDLVEKAKVECDLDRVILIPCAQSPFKTGSNTIADAEERFQMLKNAIAERGWEDWAEASRLEIDRPPPSFSWETAEHYRDFFPDAELFWILGTDQWNSIERWAEPEKLRNLLKFIVVTRNDTLVQDRPKWQEISIRFEHPASSTAIREGGADNGWIPESNQPLVSEIYS